MEPREGHQCRDWFGTLGDKWRCWETGGDSKRLNGALRDCPQGLASLSGYYTSLSLHHSPRGLYVSVSAGFPPV